MARLRALVLAAVLGALAPSAAGGVAVADEPVRSPATVQDWLPDALAGGRTVQLPAGRYVLTRTLRMPAGSTLLLDPGAVITGDIPGQSLIRLQSRTRLHGGTVTNTARQDCLGVDLEARSSDATIDAVTFRGARTNAVYVNAPDVRRLAVRGNRFIGTTFGVLVNAGALRARTLTVAGNTFLRTTGDAIEVNAAVPRRADMARDVRITGNAVRDMRGSGGGSGFAVGLAGVQGFRVAGNRFVGARTEAVHVEDRSNRGVVEDNVIQGGGTAERPAVALYRTVDAVRVRTNRILDYRGDGIGVRWDSIGSATRIAVVRNVVRHVAGTGVIVAGNEGTGPFTVRRNVVEDVRGDGVDVLGTHARSSVEDNRIRRTRGAVVSTRYAGRGLRASIRNGAMDGVAARAVLGSEPLIARTAG